MLILVTGSRTWTDRDLMAETLLSASQLVRDGRRTALMHGDSPGGGADRMAGALAEGWGWIVIPRPPAGRSKPDYLARDRAMVDEAVDLRTRWGTSVLVVAFAMDCARPGCPRGPAPHLTHGTAYTMQYASRPAARLTVHVARPRTPEGAETDHD